LMDEADHRMKRLWFFYQWDIDAARKKKDDQVQFDCGTT